MKFHVYGSQLTKSERCLAFLIIFLSFFFNTYASFSYPSWFDEAVISDIAFNFSKGLGYQQKIFDNDSPSWVYGPVYFFITSLFLKFFEFSPFLFRSIGLVSVYFLAYLFYLLVVAFTKNNKTAFIFSLMLLLDPEINRSAVSGRMDMLCVLFVFVGLYFLVNYFSCLSSSSWKVGLVLSALFSAMAFLTTPRGLFLLPMNFFLFFFFLKNKYDSSDFNLVDIVLTSAIFFSIFLLPIFIWIFSRGGFSEYYSVFVNSKTYMAHVGPSFFRRKIDYLLIIIVLLFYFSNFKIFSKNIFLTSILLTYFAFSLFVKEVGPYASMIYPFVYLFFAIVWSFSERLNSTYKINLSSFILAFIFILFSGIFLVRGTDILFVNRECRSTAVFKKSLFKNISKKNNVIADFEYYFLLKESSKNFVEFNSFVSNIQRFKFQPDYIILANVKRKSLEELYPGLSKKLQANYLIFGYYDCNSSKLFGISGIFPFRRNYSGTLVFVRNDLLE